ncbi:hypothetical protein B2J93_4686 [Marssonina coronariae]|uniref:Uncharacterized protein n=1 Tax=Diplocarpon coronariae TaxID=2795749 RepID=A0A218Z3K2_9HELO|nr:hypothetical protein B2J93_4686 [Marssonina coronariae]
MRAGLLARAAKRHVQFRRYDVLSPSLIDEQLWETWAERSSANPGEDGAQIREERGQEGEERERNRVDIIISNPPYISQRAFDTETTRSVRNWEPRLALIPSDASTGTDDKQHAGKGGGKVPKIVGGVEVEDEDIFYVRLMAIHDLRYSKVCVMEVGDEEQAQRVVVLFNHLPLAHYNRIEFWRDQPSSSSAPGEDIFMFHKPGGHHIPFPVRGTGKIRAVVLFRDRLMPRHKHGSKWHEGERHEGESRMREKNESKRYGRQRERAGDDRPRF